VTVSALVLNVGCFIFPSFDQKGMSPHCKSTGRRVPLSRSRTAVSMGSVGAMFHDGLRFGAGQRSSNLSLILISE
jgi:hypothetical protein